MADAVIGALRVNLGIDTAQFSNGLAGAKKSLNVFGAGIAVSLNDIGEAIGRFVGSIPRAIKGVVDLADKMDVAAQKFGVPIETLTRLKYAAEIADVSFESLGTSLGKLNKNMDDAASGGTGKAADAFERLGITIENTDGTLRSQENVIGQLAEKFSVMPDSVQKSALAMDIFGKSGADMIPLLNEGKDGIKALTDEADDFGLTISKKTAAQADAFNKTLDRLGSLWDGLATTLTARLLPYLQRLAEIIFNFVKDKAKMDTIFDGITAGVKWLVESVAKGIVYIENFGNSVSALASIASAFAKGDWLGVADGVSHFGDVLDENKARVDDMTESVKHMWDNLGDGKIAPPAANDNTDRGGGSGYDKLGDEEQADRDRLQAKLERLQESLRTEEESELASYQKRLEQLQEFQNAGILGTQAAADLRTQIELDHANKVKDIQDAQLTNLSSTIGSAGSIISSLSTIMGKEGDKQMAMVKALGVAEALINTYVGITQALRDPTLTTFGRFAAAAAVAAQGFAAVASLRSTSKSGSGGGGSAAAGSGASAAPAASDSGGGAHTVFIQGIDPNLQYSGEQMRNLVDSLNKAHGDGYVLKVAA